MERKVWSRTYMGRIYPNLYTVLVGPPGTGKSVIISYCERMLRQVEEIHIAPSSVTSASLIDTLSMSSRKVLHPAFFQFNSVQVLSSELQNFLPAYEASFMGLLTKIYDCELYEERRRTGKVNHIKIDNTQLNLLAGTTPSYLNSLLPEGAWDQGFTSRTIFIFSEKTVINSDIFSEHDTEYSDQLGADLLFDLKMMMHVVGQAVWDKAARSELEEWHRQGMKPVPGHARLTHYNSRRLVHVVKLATVAALSRGNALVVLPCDFQAAREWLLEAEAHMPDIFKSMAITGEARAMEDAHYYLKQLYLKMKGPVPEHYLIGFLKDRIASQNLSKVIETMTRSRMIKQEFISSIPHYTPL